MGFEQVLDEDGGVASNKVDRILSLVMSRGHRMKRENFITVKEYNIRYMTLLW